MSIMNTKVPVNDYNFTEKKKFGEPVAIAITNGTARTMKFGETVFVSGWVGNVMDQDGIAAGASGHIDVNPDRHISMNQVDAGDTFAAGANPIYFQPQTDSAAGKFVDALSATAAVTLKAEVIGASPATTPAYIEFKPPYQNGDLVATT